ncbi:MAG: hypothetical protein NC184_00190 [Roseburia sp.]|nr:hypothetical protein [Roseburia sp.]
MIDIAKKRMPEPLAYLMVYFGFCAASMFSMRGNMAYYGQSYGWPSWFTNDIWAFFLGGLVPTVLYIIIATFGFRSLTVKLRGGVTAVKYGLHFAVTAANILLFCLKFIYLAVPLYASLLDIIFDPVIMLAFVALYMWYVFKMDYVDKTRFRLVLSQVMGAFITVYGVLTVLSLILAVV